MSKKNMDLFRLNGIHSRWIWILWISTLLFLQINAIAQLQEPEKSQRCTYNKAYKMYGAQCSGLNLYAVPETLKTSIEILDLSFNRIRELKNNTFSNYRNVKYMYLGENMIFSIDVLTFEPLVYLEVLDLSINALRTLPSNILNLPSLRKLYLNDNQLNELNHDLEEMEKPFKAPLTFLSMAKCGLTKFPNFGLLPELKELNVSDNILQDFTTKDVAKLCGLETIDLTMTNVPNENVCSYKQLAIWFISKQIKMIPEVYSTYNPENDAHKLCVDGPEDEVLEIRSECLKRIQVKTQEKKSKMIWIIVGSCIGGTVVLVILVLYIISRMKARKLKIRKNPHLSSEHAKLKTGVI